MKKNIYTTTFILISCILFLSFAVGLLKNPYGSQRQIFFMSMNNFFADFFNILHYIADRDPYFNPRYGGGAKTYFPLTYVILYPFSQLDNFNIMTLQEARNSRMGIMSLFLFTGFSVSLFLIALHKIIKKYFLSPLLLVSLVLSYIFFFSIERGNTVILSAAFIGFFICYYDSDNKYENMFAIISLALAATLKIYPVLFGFLYFEKKQYREILLGAIITLLLVFLPFSFLKRSSHINILQLINNMGASVGSNVVIAGTHFSRAYPRFRVAHLIFRILLQLKFSGRIILSLSNIAQYITYFICFSSIVFSCLIKNKWLKISLLTMAFIFLPADSGLYCGLYVFPMIILFFGTLKERSKLFNIFTIIAFIIFLNPYQIISKEGDSINYLLANIALLMLWIVLLIYSGKQIIVSKIIFKIKMTVINKLGTLKKNLFSQKERTIDT